MDAGCDQPCAPVGLYSFIRNTKSGVMNRNRDHFPALAMKADAIGEEIGKALHDGALGLAVWAAMHGLAMLVLENVIDLGQRRSGLHVLPARSEIILRSLFSTNRD